MNNSPTLFASNAAVSAIWSANSDRTQAVTLKLFSVDKTEELKKFSKIENASK